jgi:uracil-DNA glycosylase
VTTGDFGRGQAPGDKEPKLGRPFAWTAGKTLFKWFHGALGWSEDEVARPDLFRRGVPVFPGEASEGGDRVPAPEEIANCAAWLEREFALLRPKLVLPVGKLAIAQFLGERPLVETIGRKFSITYRGHAVDCIPLPHPSGASTWHRMEPGKSAGAGARAGGGAWGGAVSGRADRGRNSAHGQADRATSVDAIPHGLTEHGGAGDFGGGAAHFDHAFGGAKRGVAGDDQIGGRGFFGGAQRLGFDHVEAGAGEVAVAQGGEDGDFPHDVAAGGVHEEGAGFQQRRFRARR